MPQLEVGNFAPQLVWLAITFIALYWVMAKIAIPRISNTLEERADRIADDLDAAEEFNKKADAAQKNYEEALADARAEAHEIAAKARAEIDAEIQKETEALEAKLAEESEAAERRIRETTQAALSNVSAIAAEAGGLIVEKVADIGVDEKSLAKIVDEELERREARLER